MGWTFNPHSSLIYPNCWFTFFSFFFCSSCYAYSLPAVWCCAVLIYNEQWHLWSKHVFILCHLLSLDKYVPWKPSLHYNQPLRLKNSFLYRWLNYVFLKYIFIFQSNQNVHLIKQLSSRSKHKLPVASSNTESMWLPVAGIVLMQNHAESCIEWDTSPFSTHRHISKAGAQQWDGFWLLKSRKRRRGGGWRSASSQLAKREGKGGRRQSINLYRLLNWVERLAVL